MSGPRGGELLLEDRRGDRRAPDQPTCCACGGELVEAVQEAGVVVYCKSCGAADRRSTEGNRRRAELELGALCRRIERELGGLRGRVAELESRSSDTPTRAEATRTLGEELEEIARGRT